MQESSLLIWVGMGEVAIFVAAWFLCKWFRKPPAPVCVRTRGFGALLRQSVEEKTPEMCILPRSTMLTLVGIMDAVMIGYLVWVC